MINKPPYHPDLLNGHPPDNIVLVDTHPKITVQMTELNHHRFRPRHVDALHPPLRPLITVIFILGQTMTPRWLVEA